MNIESVIRQALQDQMDDDTALIEEYAMFEDLGLGDVEMGEVFDQLNTMVHGNLDPQEFEACETVGELMELIEEVVDSGGWVPGIFD